MLLDIHLIDDVNGCGQRLAVIRSTDADRFSDTTLNDWIGVRVPVKPRVAVDIPQRRRAKPLP